MSFIVSIFLIIFLFVLVLVLLNFFISYIAYLFKKRTFPTYSFNFCVGSFAILLLFYIYHQFFFTFAFIDIEHAEVPTYSPNNEKMAQVMYEYYGGAAGGVNALVKLTMDEANKYIYYADAKSSVLLQWQSNDELLIMNKDSYGDETILLNVTTELYDSSGRACKSLLLKGKYENCYSNNEK